MNQPMTRKLKPFLVDCNDIFRTKLIFLKRKQNYGSGGIRTHASEETGALNQRLRPLGHATSILT